VPPGQRAQVLWLLSPRPAKMDHWRDEIVEGERAWRLRVLVVRSLVEDIRASLSAEDGDAVLLAALQDSLPVHLLP